MEERDRLAAENERIAAELDRLVELLGSIAHEGDQARTAVCRLNEELRGAWLLHRPSELAGTGPLIATQMVIFPQPANSGASLDQESKWQSGSRRFDSDWLRRWIFKSLWFPRGVAAARTTHA